MCEGEDDPVAPQPPYWAFVITPILIFPVPTNVVVDVFVSNSLVPVGTPITLTVNGAGIHVQHLSDGLNGDPRNPAKLLVMFDDFNQSEEISLFAGPQLGEPILSNYLLRSWECF